MVDVGDRAPGFDLPATGGGRVSLAGLRGKKVVLYFYPSDGTPTCTKQACAFRKGAAMIEGAEGVIVGISPDGVESHDKFRTKYRLPFVLVADEGHKVADAYGVWVKKSMFGVKYMGIERTTFVIDRAGKVAAVFRKVRVKGHVEAVGEALASLG